MTISCLPEFKIEFEKLKGKRPYRNLEKDLIGYFFNKKINQLLNGGRLNGHDVNPYIKKKLDGSGGYRFYFLIIIKDDHLYLMFVHPKMGPDGAENITDESKALLYKKVITAIETKDLYMVALAENESKLKFQRYSTILSKGF